MGASRIKLFLLLLSATTALTAQSDTIRIIAFGAHPDDCDIRAAGTAALWAKMGNAVKFVSVTNGDAGHQTMHAAELARRRLAEAKESARRLGIEYDVLNNHDGELLPTLDVRKQIIREIRQWNADVVLSPRPNDYHPDHRYTGVLVQDAAYMVVVPSVTPDTPALRKNPVFLYYEDGFQRPNPFRPDVAVDIGDSINKKIEALDSHVSQFYEWLPWVDGKLEEVPKDAIERKAWLKRTRTREISPAVRAALVKWYGAQKGNAAKYYEAFEICEYGAQPNDARIRHLFPMLH
ncbi:MAG: PIG-L family deacetylase [Acidobacteriota bacterium]|nr:PIG-L family deacetylase [Acidobacteriota bacterium]